VGSLPSPQNINKSKAMVLSSISSRGLYRVAVEAGSPVASALRSRENSADGSFRTVEIKSGPPEAMVSLAIEAGAHLLISASSSGRGGLVARWILHYDGSRERKRKESPFLVFEPHSFFLTGDNLEEKSADFAICMVMLEMAQHKEILNSAGRWTDPPFQWLAGMAHLLTHSPKKAFAAFNQIPYVDEGMPEEETLFKSGMVNSAISLLQTALDETDTQQGPFTTNETEEREKPDALAQVLAMLDALAESVVPAKEPELAGMIRYNLGRASLAAGRGMERAIAEYRAALEVSPQISAHAEAACATALAGALFNISHESTPGSAERLTEAETLANHAMLVYSRDNQPAAWASTHSLLGMILAAAAELVSGTERVGKLARAVDSFSLAVEEMGGGQAQVKERWAVAMMGLCGALVALGATVGNERGLGFVDEALALLDDAEPRLSTMPGLGLADNVQLGRAGALIVKKQIQGSLSV